MGEGLTIPTDPYHTPTFIQPSTQPQKTQQPRKPKRKDTQIPQPSDPIENVTDEAAHKELGDSLVRAATTASSLEAEQDSGNINKTQSKATPNESSSLGTTLGGGPGAKKPWGILLLKVGLRMYLNIPMIHCSQEKTKTTQHNEITSLKRRVKKPEKKNRSRTHKLNRLYKVGLTARVESSDNEESLGEDASKQDRINAIDADEEITLVSVQNVDEEMFDVNVLDGEELFVAIQEVVVKDVNNEVNVVEEVVEVINSAKLITDAAQVSAATTTTATITTIDDITLAQALMEIKSIKPKEKGVVIQELEAQISLIMFEFSSCLLADSAINLVSDSSSQQASQKFGTSFLLYGFLKLFHLFHFCEYSAISWMAILASSAVLEDLQAHALKQEEAPAAWTKSVTSENFRI
ncbi:hypothetical protein Tco_0216944 [Tanacetum coccineum]